MGTRSDAGLWVRGSKAHSEWRESQACAQELKPELKYTWEGTRKLHVSLGLQPAMGKGLTKVIQGTDCRSRRLVWRPPACHL